MASEEALIRAIRSLTQRSDCRVATSQQTLSEKDFVAVTSELQAIAGDPLPDDYFAFLIGLGALGAEADPSLWPPPEPRSIGPAWAFLRGLEVLGAGADIPPELRIVDQTRELRRVSGLPLVPVIRRLGDRNVLCFGMQGWCEWTPDRPRDPKPCAEQDFRSLLLVEITAFEGRLRRVEEERARNPRWTPWSAPG